MSFEIKLAVRGRLMDFYKEELDAGARAATEGMRLTIEQGKEFARSQVIRAGLGERLAKTWRGETYPNRGKAVSMKAAGILFNKAPDIVHGYANGGTIVPINGKRYLAIPTSYAMKLVPTLVGNMRRTKKVTPQRLADHLGVKLVLRWNRHGTAWLEGQDLRLSRSKKATRTGTAKRASDKMIAKGKAVRLPLFWLVRQVQLPKLLDLPAIEQHMEERLVPNVLQKWEEYAPRS